ncbi:MAG: CRTAC1 family protein [Vicinamibacteria bacterium]
MNAPSNLDRAPRSGNVALGCAAAALLVALGARGALATVPNAPAFRFTDVAPRAGLTRVTSFGRPGKDHLLDSVGGGVAFLDYDRDGILDVYVVNGWRLDGSAVVEKGRNALYKGLPDGTFRDVTDEAGVGGEGQWGSGAFVADYDGDGWPDILVTNFGPNVLYRNLGNGRFENVAREAGVEAPGWNTGAAFFDADGDGHLDLYIASYIDATLQDVLNAKPTLNWRGLETVAFGPFGLKGARDHFFHSVDGHRFVDATAESGMEDKAQGFGFAVRAADYDGDGKVDLYVANDSDPNYLYRNDGKGVFTEVATWEGCALDANGASQASMGLAVGDVDGDGVLDLVTTNFSEDFATLYHGLGHGLFEDLSRASGIGPATYKPLKWGTALADLDNDGDLDLVIANGHIYPQIDRHPEVIGTYAQRNTLMENISAGGPITFRDVTDTAGPGFEPKAVSRGLAIGDFDNDGRLDILISHVDGPPSLLHNETPGGAWLTVVCEDSHGGTNPIGTQVTIRAGGKRQWRDIAAGDSFLSTHDPRPHFGLGATETVDEVDVRWPDGTHSLRRDVAARQFLRVRQGT